ncbi:23S rRNA (adenine(2503)-C(2))-methyltransferase RlmN [bacterium]|jgi:23S rRNA (adenine2503-C2)-methyltransferase|nr:23S rRNA (adenine(2503)-C(2))-methyltransferase RlmN [bacterium]MBT4649465.1 23S rRNA (adenine(2503)-C(2))-methyltransferase RlmN [bacterium]
MNLDNLYKVLEGQPKFRATQVKEAIFKQLIKDWSEASTLSLDLRQKLNQECPLEINADISQSKEKDTSKVLIKLEDGEEIETVLMSHKDGRHTVCVSSQVGCAMACKFCATGQMGFKRNLTVSEILEQVLFFARLLKEKGERVSNVVFMGMGEPFLNYDNVMSAIDYLNDANGLNIGARRISVSTCGILPGIKKFTQQKLQINLAISLHAPNDKLRSELMPINQKQPLKKLMAAVGEYVHKTGRKVMFEYLMIKGVNDSVKYAQQLATLMADPLFMVNLIPYNPTGVYLPSDKKTMNTFRQYLEHNDIEVTQRYALGQDIDAACGQLANKKKNK